jgi:hypothetical protein
VAGALKLLPDAVFDLFEHVKIIHNLVPFLFRLHVESVVSLSALESEAEGKLLWKINPRAAHERDVDLVDVLKGSKTSFVTLYRISRAFLDSSLE